MSTFTENGRRERIVAPPPGGAETVAAELDVRGLTERVALRPLARRLQAARTVRRWVVAWIGAPALAIVNGAARELVYRDGVGESAADQISVAPLIALLAIYFWALQRRWPLATKREALSVGAVWAAFTVLFELGFGHYVEGDSWADLLRTYDVTAGNLWILIPLWVAAGPIAVRALAGRRMV